MLSDISYSYSEDSSYENVIKSNYDNYKLKSALTKKSSPSNILKDVNIKTCEVIFEFQFCKLTFMFFLNCDV